jgi:hypothetical protein
MLVVPAFTPVTPTGELAFTVAIDVFAELHVPPAVASLNVVILAWQTVFVPVIAAGDTIELNDLDTAQMPNV